MNLYNIVKQFFDAELYTENNVKSFWLAGKITEEEYKEIVEKSAKA